MPDLLSPDELPAAFSYPSRFVRLVQLGLTNLEPWWVLQGLLLRDCYSGLQKRYARRKLIPFAKRQDNDDIACFDVDSSAVMIIHDFATPGYEQRATFTDFDDWLRHAIEDFIAFE